MSVDNEVMNSKGMEMARCKVRKWLVGSLTGNGRKLNDKEDLREWDECCECQGKTSSKIRRWGMEDSCIPQEQMKTFFVVTSLKTFPETGIRVY